ncbi:MAG: D-alanyl-D-alanine carboxypeptidase family protein [Erysipelotrichaceae bacterium]|nr:D-alanyl-D-alanine carboxypeptidase family protein [Erysipelotrichaceae bacterium]
MSDRTGSARLEQECQTGNINDNILVVTNKKHALPAGYEPDDLVRPRVEMLRECYVRRIASAALEEMFAAARNEGIHLVLGSAYRSETRQRELYDKYCQQYGRQEADTFSSRPGHSEHQTGLAADISDHDAATYLSEEFENTPEGQWLLQHAHEYGFILRYPKDKEEITGYVYEPWHYRFVGKEAAKALFNEGSRLTMEEYYDIEGGNYAR